ncbi:MAG: helicase C-terminal domain-containing protein [Patescibacteria group bacterium]
MPGDTLKYLVIHKFPFGVPSDPIFQARSEFFEDSFRDYAIPKAIIKLKQ